MLECISNYFARRKRRVHDAIIRDYAKDYVPEDIEKMMARYSDLNEKELKKVEVYGSTKE